jgi:hypothetical protein
VFAAEQSQIFETMWFCAARSADESFTANTVVKIEAPVYDANAQVVAAQSVS